MQAESLLLDQISDRILRQRDRGFACSRARPSVCITWKSRKAVTRWEFLFRVCKIHEMDDSFSLFEGAQNLGASAMTSDEVWNETELVQSRHLRVTHFDVPTRRSLISPLRERLLSSVADFEIVDEGRQNHFCMALEEALNNAFYHGNLEINSELKEGGSSAFIELARERETLEPYRSRMIRVTEIVGLFGLWICICDEGSGFDVGAAMERCNNPELMLASGRGLLLMKGFTDELIFNGNGNEVTLVLYRTDEDREKALLADPKTGDITRIIS